jgi:hypothetical protein
MSEDTLLAQARRGFHADLLRSILTLSETGVPSNADKDSRLSRDVAASILSALGNARTDAKGAGQTAGKDFETICANFVDTCFRALGHIRPGNFTVSKGGAIARFDQYAHLAKLDLIARSNREVAIALGADYLIKPDIVIARAPVDDDNINLTQRIVDDQVARLSPLRSSNSTMPSLHASISCKWTLRSDRAQNARSEGLNLVRNRKGKLPHIAVITAEPMPSRIASLALGTGDIDCVYHFALPELVLAIDTYGNDDSKGALSGMIEGRRLRDIADLPLDLVI